MDLDELSTGEQPYTTDLVFTPPPRRRTAGFTAVVAVVAAVALVGAAAALARRGGDAGGEQLRTGQPRSDTPVAGGRLLYGLAGDPEGLDPGQIRWDESGLQVGNALYDPVTAFDAEGHVLPYLVESLTPTSDLSTWLFRLRPDVVLSTGDPLDADAFVDYLQSMRRSAVAGSVSQLITEVRALDNRSVQLRTSRPWATLPVHLAGQSGFVYSSRKVDVGAGVSVPAGTGPFRLRRWDRGRRLELVRNPRYWRSGLPRLDAVELEVVPDGPARFERVRRGELDVAPMCSPGDQRAFEETNARQPPELRLALERDARGATATAVLFNTDRAPLNDVRIRRALAHGTDVRAIAAANGWPTDRLANGPIDPRSPYFTAAPYPTFDLDRARTLVRDYLADPKAGRVREPTFGLHAAGADTRLLNQLIEQWAQVGIRARLVIDDSRELRQRAARGELDAVWVDDIPAVDPDQLWPYLVPEPTPPAGTFSFARSGDPTITAAMTDGRGHLDGPRRGEAYTGLQRALADQVPFLWLVRPEQQLAVSARVQGARNVTLPDGAPAMPFVGGAHRLTETWIAP